MTDQLAFDYAHLRQPIQQRFDAWITSSDGQTVYREFVKRALSLRNRGWRHYSHKAIVESIRYDAAIRVGPESGFKVNDHYTSRLVRRAIEEWPELGSFFETRNLREEGAA